MFLEKLRLVDTCSGAGGGDGGPDLSDLNSLLLFPCLNRALRMEDGGGGGGGGGGGPDVV